MTVALTNQDKDMIRNTMRDNILSLLNDHKPKLENSSSNKFFLTQSNEDEDPKKQVQEDLDRGKTGVLKHGIELKLQRNILSKYKYDDDIVSKNLLKKREEFEERINLCKEKHGQLVLKQEKNQQLIKQYSQFINEKEAIRKRAITKYQTELKTRLQKMLEYDILMKQLEEVRETHQEFTLKVDENKKYKEFLSKVIELLPDNYLEAGESKYTSLMMRHQTLYDTNLDLFENLIDNSDKLKVLRNEYERINIDHNSNKMTMNSKLGELMQVKEQMLLKNSRAEETIFKDGDKKRERVMDISRIVWGIDNLAEKALDQNKYANKSLDSMSLNEKLDCIKDYVMKKNEIYKVVKEQTSHLPKIASY